MKTIEQKSENKNYAARPITITELKPHPNADRLKIAVVNGEDVIVDLNTQTGDKVVLFPIECKINPLFLTTNSLYRKGQGENKDPEKTGMFDKHGRVRAIRLRGVVSKGFIVPLTHFTFLQPDNADLLSEIAQVECFDTINGVRICEKYVIKHREQKGQKYHRRKNLSEKIVEKQWRFHYETEWLDNNLERILPPYSLHISYKLHGTSICAGCVLVKKFSWRPAIWFANKFLGGNESYHDVWSSRRVIKTPKYKKVDRVFYEDDIWTRVYTDVLQGKLTNGLTIYGEIVGYLPNGGGIQGEYDYGFTPPEGKEYFVNKNYGLFIYRVTNTNKNGVVTEMNPFEVAVWCKNNGLDAVPFLASGKATDFYAFNEPAEDSREEEKAANLASWRQHLYEAIKNDPRFYLEKRCFMCKNNVPAEGIVVRIIETGEAFKLKSKAFLLKETEQLDKGEENIEG
ncbi:hypothetical protein AGMMS50262_19620 [Bacteroidia bacterium]|nr:hypothetical protein AGMMS50262_19620 [Bacteroidia bacterium]